MARNEADIIATTVAHMLTQVDHVLVADNLSADDTAALAAEAGAEVITDPDPAYRQSEKMTALAARAREAGAGWVVPFDADEAWMPADPWTPVGVRLADLLNEVQPRINVVAAELFDHVPTGHDDLSDGNPLSRMGWRRRAPGALPKVACRTATDLTIAMGNHDATYSDTAVRLLGVLQVRHYPYRSGEQFVRKAVQGAAALALTDLHRSMGAHWREYARIAERDGVDALAAVFTEWFYADDPHGDASLVFDPARL